MHHELCVAAKLECLPEVSCHRLVVQVGRTYRYCVIVTSAATSVYFLDAAKPLNPMRFESSPVCQDVTIQWAGQLTGEVRQR